MVLIIRNNRILTRRHSRINKLLSYVRKNHQKVVSQENKVKSNLDLTAMTSASTLGVLFICSIAMFTLPFAAFYGVQHIMINEFHSDRFVSNCVSVLAAVIMVNLIITCYVYYAFQEKDDPPQPGPITEHPVTKDNLNKKDK